MRKQRVLLTGATGSMGEETLAALIKDIDIQDIVVFALDSERDRSIIAKYNEYLGSGLEVIWGDLTSYYDCRRAVRNVDIVLHLAALVSPLADKHPQLAMEVNLGSTYNLLHAIKEEKKDKDIKFLYIGTVAETGDRLPPIHWGRIGDPIKPSIYDYYAVSKVAAERAVIESGLKYWVSFRQTGIVGSGMTKIFEPIILHNPLNNVLEYISDSDSAELLRSFCRQIKENEIPEDFWQHCYNMGGGDTNRASGIELYERVFAIVGFHRVREALEPKVIASNNFHGQYFLDSYRLEEQFKFRTNSLDYFYKKYAKRIGRSAKWIYKLRNWVGIQKTIAWIIRKLFRGLGKRNGGTIRGIRQLGEPYIAAYWGSKAYWDSLPSSYAELPDELFRPLNLYDVVEIDHGYDDTKPESELTYEDVKSAVEFRGGELLSKSMQTGNWQNKLEMRCAFGHEFSASPRLILHAGHGCPECENKSWNYGNRAKVNKFLAQVWYPLHAADEPVFEYEKTVHPDIIFENNISPKEDRFI